MTLTPRPTAQFVADAEQAARWYRNEGEAGIARRFLAALEEATALIAEFPDAGSLRYGELAGLDGLRSVALASFPHLLFYVRQDDVVVLLRVLHDRRDIPATLSDG